MATYRSHNGEFIPAKLFRGCKANLHASFTCRLRADLVSVGDDIIQTNDVMHVEGVFVCFLLLLLLFFTNQAAVFDFKSHLFRLGET